MGRLLGPNFPSDLGLAVSGGGDSMAMLALTHGWARVMGVRLWVVTVDHGLREGSADEAAMVATECAALGHAHATLRWHWDGQGNLQDTARRARLALIDRWRGGLTHILFAHTQDDVAETFLMRLARGSGVEGLSAISDIRHVQPHISTPHALAEGEVTQTAPPPGDGGEGTGFYVIRPLLQEARADLRHYARTLKLPFVDDPSNKDPRFDRAKARAALETLGIDAATLQRTAARMLRASEALAARAVVVARDCVLQDMCQGKPTGDLLIDRDRFVDVEQDTQLRLLAAALQWVSSADYRPRAEPLEALLERALAGGGGTLHGARVIASGASLRITREFAAVKDLRLTLGEETAIWDRRWHIVDTGHPGLTLRALGPDGWQQLAEKPDGLPPHDATITLPALFDGDRLMAWYLGPTSPAFEARFTPRGGDFTAFLQSR